MPSLQLYISKADAELVKKARAELRVSLSSIFAEALKKKLDRAAKAGRKNGGHGAIRTGRNSAAW